MQVLRCCVNCAAEASDIHDDDDDDDDDEWQHALGSVHLARILRTVTFLC